MKKLLIKKFFLPELTIPCQANMSGEHRKPSTAGNPFDLKQSDEKYGCIDCRLIRHIQYTP